MFYSHEVLTNRKYGVATVWLVATLGSKSSLKKITRKQMLDVDVAKACNTIVDPAAPMALRLQGNLLYGVSRVYLQQCDYILADAQNAHNTLLLALRSVKNFALDPSAGKARPEHLVLQDDPSFLPDLTSAAPDLLFDIDMRLDAPSAQSLTPLVSQGSASPHVGCGIVLPSSSPARPAGVGLAGDDEMLDIDDLLGLEEPEFVFGEDGDMIEFSPEARALESPVRAGVRGRGESDERASERVRREHEEGRVGVGGVLGGELGGVLGGELGSVQGDVQGDVQALTSPNMDTNLPIDSTSTLLESVSTSAPQRHAQRRAKPLPKDRTLELSNTTLLSWQTSYLANMQLAGRRKAGLEAKRRARKNAERFVWGAGLGGVGHSSFSARGPLSGFAGSALFELMTGLRRSREDGGAAHEPDSEGHTVKRARRAAGREQGRAEDTADGLALSDYNNDEMHLSIDLSIDMDVENPRSPAQPLPSHPPSSTFPWTKHSSLPPSHLSAQSLSRSRAGSRVPTVSPLQGRGAGYAAVWCSSEADDFLGGAGVVSDDAGDGVDVGVGGADGVEAEEGAFVGFVAGCVRERGGGGVVFEDLLPPGTARGVVVRGFWMVLVLASRGVLGVGVREGEGWGVWVCGGEGEGGEEE